MADRVDNALVARCRDVFLVDEFAFGGVGEEVIVFGLDENVVVGGVDFYTVAFASEDGLANPVAHAAAVARVGGYEVRVAGVLIPERGEQQLIGEEHLPRRLNPAVHGAVVGEEELVVACFAVGDQVFPGVELEEVGDAPSLCVFPALGVFVEDDFVDGNHVGFDARLLCRVGDEPEVVVVLVGLVNLGGHVRQVQYGLHARGDFGGEDVAPTVGEGFADFTPVGVAAGVEALVFRPGFLADCRLHDAGGGVGVVFEQFHGVAGHTRVGEVEAAVEVGVAAVPGFYGEVECRLRQAEGAERAGGNVLDGFQAHAVHFFRLGAHRVHFLRAENVGGVFVPVVVGVVGAVHAVGEAFLNDDVLPVGSADGKFFAAHEGLGSFEVVIGKRCCYVTAGVVVLVRKMRAGPFSPCPHSVSWLMA